MKKVGCYCIFRPPLAISPRFLTVSSIIRQFIKDSYSTGNLLRKYGTGLYFYNSRFYNLIVRNYNENNIKEIVCKFRK